MLRTAICFPEGLVVSFGVRSIGAILAIALVCSDAGAEQGVDPAPGGSGASHWGPIPARADSVVTRLEESARPAWEKPIAASWWVATRPFALARVGTRGTLNWLEESGALATVRRWLAPIELPYGFSLSASGGGLSGWGAGLAFYHDAFLGPDHRLRLKAAASSRQDRRVTAGLIVPLAAGRSVEFGAGYRIRGQARYFGLGPRTRYADEAYFTQESFWGGMIVEQDLGVGGLSVKGRGLYTTLDSRGPLGDDFEIEEDGELDDPPVDIAFADALPTGYGERSDGWVLGLALERATADQTGRPREGGLQRAQIAYFRPDRAGEAAFVTYRLETQNFVDLWWDRALAVRGSWSWIEDDGEAVHFQRLMTNDEPDLLRGYDDFRWRDKGFTALTVEYRYPVWDYRDPGDLTLDAYTFYDTGQVFGHQREIALATLTHSYGLGFRLSAHGGFVGRLEIGFSEEDTVIRLRADQMFQFDRQGLYHGREPIPLR